MRGLGDDVNQNALCYLAVWTLARDSAYAMRAVLFACATECEPPMLETQDDPDR